MKILMDKVNKFKM